MSRTIKTSTKYKVSTVKHCGAGRFAVIMAVFLTVMSGRPVQAAFQEYLWGARPAAMAGAFTALADDSNAPVYNPAGISLMAISEVTFMYAQLYSGLDLQAGNNTTKLGLGYFSFIPQISQKKYGSFGFSWSNFRGTNIYKEDTFYLTYANAYHLNSRTGSNPIYGYGVNLKMLRRDITSDSRTDADPVFSSGSDSDAISADIGFIARPDLDILPGLKFGLTFQNINEPDVGLASTDRVPLKTTLGVAYQDREYRWFNPSLDISERKGRTIIAASWEGWFAKDTLAFRFGGDEDRLAGGLGYQFRFFGSSVIRLDYALLWPLEIEGSDGSHRISLTTSF